MKNSIVGFCDARRGPLPSREALQLALLVALLTSLTGCARQETRESAELLPPPEKKIYNPPYPNDPVTPFQIIGNIYYVGMANYSAYLISTPEGLILLDTMVESTLPQLQENIRALGFRVEDIKILLQAHAHVDHVGGLADLKQLTGAQVYVMAEDAEVLADGGVSDFRSDGRQLWKPVQADVILRDGDQVSLGGTTMVAHLTAGHTKGCTTWSTQVEEGGRSYNVVLVCSNRVNANVPMLNNPKYPGMAEAFASGFEKLKGLPCDVFLASHAFMFNMEEKRKRKEAGAETNPFIDPEGYRTYIADFEYDFRYRLQQERLGQTAEY
jgi:metallo-beta-lactamase class B